MISLKKTAELPIEVQDDFSLKFHKPLPQIEPVARTFREMRSVLMDPDSSSTRDEMYYMYRNVHLPEDAEKIKQLNLSYDITVLPPAMIGKEFNKTVGHYHAYKPGTHFAFPEIYQVLHGKALFLLQKMDPEFKEVISVIAMEAKEGEKVIYPPNYGHIIVNIGPEVLVTANWVGDHFERMYDPISKMRGMDYYVVADESLGHRFVPNKSYKSHPQVRILSRKFMHNFSIMQEGSMYSLGIADPKSLEFLNHPEKYAIELSSITS